MRAHDFYHKTDGKIEYHVEKGDFWYSYREKQHLSQGSYRLFETEGIIPKEIVSEGKEAIETYVEQTVRDSVEKQKSRAKKRDDFAKNPNVAVEVRYKGVLLEGKVVAATGRWLGVELLKPYQGRSGVNYGFGSPAMFNGTTTLSEDAVASAQRLLKQIYEEEAHKHQFKGLIDLAQELNDDVE